MEVIAMHVDAARRRLLWGRFLMALKWSWFGAFLLAGLAIGLGRIWPPAIAPGEWAAWCLGIAAIVGVAPAAIWTARRADSRMDAACEIDRRFKLEERVASALALTPGEAGSAIGQAVLLDAGARLERLNVAERFPAPLHRRAWLPLGAALAALAVAWLAPVREPAAAVAAPAQAAAASKAQAQAKVLEKKLAERRAQAQEQGLENADALLKRLEDGARKLSDHGADEKKALIGLNDLAKDLDERRQKLMSSNDWKQQLKQLKDMGEGPGDKLARDMKNGDFQAALDELKKLQEQMNRGDLAPAEREKLGEQLAQAQKAIAEAVEAHEQTRRQLEQKLAQAEQAGDRDAAERLRDQLDRHDAHENQMKQMAGLGQKLGQAGAALKKGQPAEAQAALNELAEEMRAAKQADQELAMLDEALDEIADAKECMNCKAAKEGNKAAQEGNQPSQGMLPGGGSKPGRGVGRGLGPGPGADDAKKSKFYDSKVAQKVGQGRAVIEGRAAGPNRKGEAQEQIKARFASAEREADDPLTNQRLPRDYREHAKKYFESLRDGN